MGEARQGRLAALVRRLGFQSDWYLIILGAVIGTSTGLGTTGFAWLLHEAERGASGLQRALDVWWIPAVPMLGALVSGLLVWRFAGEARGHGVPQVMRAIIERNGRIPMRVGVVKVFASVFTVGSGGSAGTEGPIVQIGAVAGSVGGRLMRVPQEHMRTMVGCGAAAGIASIFNAPIAGVLFVLEILLRDFSVRVFTPIVVSAVFSSATTHALTGANVAIFAASGLEAEYRFDVVEFPAYAVLGVLCGLVAVGFNWLLHFGEGMFERSGVHAALRPMLGALLLGLLGIGFVSVYGGGPASLGGAPAFFGGGYETIRELIEPVTYDGGEVLSPVPVGALALGVLVVCKCLATTFTLGAGGSGGVFAPSLFLGAAAGGGFGVALREVGLLPEGSSPAAYALVGMGAVVAGSMHAPITAILMVIELTRDEFALLPMMLGAVLATVVSQIVQRDSIYTFRLRREGVLVGRARDLTLLRRLRVFEVIMDPLPPEPIYASDPVSKLVTMHAHHHVPDFVVMNGDGAYLGMVTGSDMRTALIDREAIPLLLVAELMQTGIPTVREQDTLDEVMNKFARYDVSCLCRVDEQGRPQGLVTRRRTLQRYQEALEES